MRKYEKIGLWFTAYITVVLFFLSVLYAIPDFYIKPFNFHVTGPDIDLKFWKYEFNKKMDYAVGMDLHGGDRFILSADLSGIQENEQDAQLEETADKLKARLRSYSIPEYTVYINDSGNGKEIDIELPFMDYSDYLIYNISKPGHLYFKQLSEENRDTEDSNILYNPVSYVDTGIEEIDVKGITVLSNPKTNEPSLQLNFTDEGRHKFSNIAKDNVGKPVAIMMDDMIISLPRISEEFASGVVYDPIISGGFTKEQAETLKAQIENGAISLNLEISGKEAFSSKIGNSNFKIICVGLIIFFSMISLFILLRYGKLGVVYNLILLFIALLTIAGLKFGTPSLVNMLVHGELNPGVFSEFIIIIPAFIGFIAGMFLLCILQIVAAEFVKNGIAPIDNICDIFNKLWKKSRLILLAIIIFCIVLGRIQAIHIELALEVFLTVILIGLYCIFQLEKNLIRLVVYYTKSIQAKF